MEFKGLLEAYRAMKPDFKAKLIKNMKEFNLLHSHATQKKWIHRDRGTGDIVIDVSNDVTDRLKAINKDTPFGGVVFKDKN